MNKQLYQLYGRLQLRAQGFLSLHHKKVKVVGLWSLWIGGALLIRIFLFQPFNIPSGSMIPTLLIGDHLFVSKFAYGYSRYAFPFQSGKVSGKILSSQPQRGDIVVFRPPLDDGQDYIKRVIGLAGDRVQMKNSRLYLNAKRVPREKVTGLIYRETLPNGMSYLTKDSSAVTPGDNTPPYIVPQGYVFVMGDNRDNSTDSRFYTIGPIPLENLIGRAEIIYMSIGATRALDDESEDDTTLSIRFNRIGKSLE